MWLKKVIIFNYKIVIFLLNARLVVVPQHAFNVILIIIYLIAIAIKQQIPRILVNLAHVMNLAQVI